MEEDIRTCNNNNNGILGGLFRNNGCGCGCGNGDTSILFFLIIFLLLFTNYGCCHWGRR